MHTSRLSWAFPIPFAVWLALRSGGWEPTFRWIQLVAFTPSGGVSGAHAAMRLMSSPEY